MAVIDGGSSTAGKANVNATFDLQVALPDATTPARVGGVRLFSENDDGAITGTAELKSPETSLDFRLRMGLDTIKFSDTFNAVAQNTAKWSYTFATLTAAQPGAGTVNFSTVQGTTSAHGAFMQTHEYFPLVNTAPLAVQFHAGQFTAAMASGEVWLMGLGLPSAAVTRPTDGVWLKLTSGGLVGVIAFNGSEVESGVLYPFASLVVGTVYRFTLVIGEEVVQYWLDDQALGEQIIPTSNGMPWLSGSAPAYMQKYNTGAVSNTNTMRVARVGVSIMDIATNQPWSHQMASQGLMGYQGINGGTMGTSASLPNATAATTVTGGALSQTVPIKTGLGGEAGIQAAAAGIDGCVTAFQNPTGGINQTARNLIITGLRIDAVNIGAAVATTASIIQWSLAYGATGAAIPSLAQAETGSFVTATAKAWRRIALGLQSWLVAAAVGTPAEQITLKFDSPVVVHPGQWVAAVAKFIVGTATASQVLWCTVSFDAHYE